MRRRRVPLRRAALVAVFLSMLAGAIGIAARLNGTPRHVPFGYLGVTVDGPALQLPGVLDSEFAQMARTGVESARFAIYWTQVQRFPDAASVPPALAARHRLLIDGIPTDFSQPDRVMMEAAKYGLSLLPVVELAPPWARKNPSKLWSPPADPAAYGRFVGVLVQRYGPSGSFWSQHPNLPQDPIHDWQIWNEPAGGATLSGRTVFWDDPEPFQDPYIAMLRAARSAIKAADPNGRVVLAGLFSRSWLALESLYQHGAKGLFDEIGINIFTSLPFDVLYTAELDRDVMNKYGDRSTREIISELSWPSAAGHILPGAILGFEVTPAQQAQRLTSVMGYLASFRAKLRLDQIFWYTWLTYDRSRLGPFDYAGLREVTRSGKIVAKPAQVAYRKIARSLEGCTKTWLATACG